MTDATQPVGVAAPDRNTDRHDRPAPRVQWMVALLASFCAATGQGGIAVGMWLLAFLTVVIWYRAAREQLRTRPRAEVTTRAVLRRCVTVPVTVLLIVVGLSVANQFTFATKHASFLWDSLPTETVAGRPYAWPGVYGADLLQRDRSTARSWYVTGGPYVPLPDEAPDQAAARVQSYLRDRFDIEADASHIEAVLAKHRGEPPPESLRGQPGALVHPYTAGLAAIESEYVGATRAVLIQRSWATALALLLVGCVAIRTGVSVRAVGPRWPIAIAVAVVGAAALAASWFTALDAVVFEAGVPLFRFHAEHAVAVTVVVLGICAALIASARRVAISVASEASGPA